MGRKMTNPLEGTGGRMSGKASANPPAPEAEPRSASEWMTRIREQEMPALGATVALVRTVTEDENASTAKLAQAILQDAAMTARILKLANSAFYNPSRQNISTISRAIVVLGLDVVSNMAIAIRLVDGLVAGGIRARVIEEMAQSFHAAVMARSIARLRKDSHGEEVFIAALLSRVGEMAFWAFGGNAAERLDGLLKGGTLTADEAQQVVLGFKLKQLSLGLAREWKLGPLLQSVLEGGRRPGVPEQAIQFAARLAAQAREGWETPRTRELIAEVAGFTGLTGDALSEELLAGTQEAARIASCFGAAEAVSFMPLPRDRVFVAEPPATPIAADPMLQLRILRELSSLIASGAALNEVLGLVLEGLYRGVGFERVLFAMLTPNRQQLIGKAGLGNGIENLRQRFIFSLGSERGELFHEFFGQPKAMMIEGGRSGTGLSAERLQAVTNAASACIAPIVVRNHVIGLFYADCSLQATPIDAERFEAFQLFVQQISLAAGRAGH